VAQEIALPAASVLGMIVTPGETVSRQALAAASMDRVEDERFHRPVPRFLTELPWGGDDDEITDRLAAAVLVAEDPDKAQQESGTIKGASLVGKAITVHDLRVMDGNLEGGWGAYLLLDVTLHGSEDHLVVNTGAKQIVTRLARCWAEGQLPVDGAICELAGTGKQGNKALAFVVEGRF
jgi:hypothetical protein